MSAVGFTDAQSEALLASVVNLGLVAYASTLDAMGQRAAAERTDSRATLALMLIDEVRRRALHSDRLRDGMLHAVRLVPNAEARSIARRANDRVQELEAFAESLRDRPGVMQTPAQAARIGADVLAIFAGMLERRHEVVS